MPLTLAVLDRAFSAWCDMQTNSNEEINAVINCIGVVFGQFLVDSAKFTWVIATDENGSDLAVIALPGEGDVLVFPANFVAKRWGRRETSFLESAYQQVVVQVQSITPQTAAKPWWKVW